ncbi:MAG: biopolymer transporter ExbD [Alphaproteobacteria bacterium]|uniref:ExbD/TolR family protein n=1 Tax=Maricaulis alexandrii TaxID=2570354 RepID=UPI00110810E5|nr:biopolymer transporter ExbD [Maricaulis alexandrii]MCR9267024.1 biopolymer transporter ExbD [Alphaproteobacteria bacterium]
MAVSLDSGRSGRGRARWKPKAEINVTPFVDVMLVLLIVFMITAPLLTVGVPVDLPDTEARNLPADEEPLTITITTDGLIYLQETEVGLAELAPRLTAIAGTGYESRIFIRADDGAAYGDVARVMANINAAGFTNLGLVTDPIEQ